jgi:hypothetical protein
MPESDLIQQQRAILRAFRQATSERSKAEAAAEARRNGEQETADGILMQAKRSVEAQRARATADAEARCQVDFAAATAQLNRISQAADASLAVVHKTQDEGQSCLIKAQMRELLGSFKLAPTLLHPDANPAEQLNQAAMSSSTATSVLRNDAAELYQARDRALIWKGCALVLVSLVILVAIFVAIALSVPHGTSGIMSSVSAAPILLDL